MGMFGKEKLPEIDAARQFVFEMTKGVQDNWPAFAAELGSTLRDKSFVPDDHNADFEFLLAAISIQMEFIQNLLPSDQGARIREHVIQCLSTPELGEYPRDAIQEYHHAWQQSLAQHELPWHGVAAMLYDKMDCKSTMELGGERYKNPILLMALGEKVLTFGGPWWKTLIGRYRLVP